VVHVFPDDATDEEIGAALETMQAPAKVFKAGDPVTWAPANPADFTQETAPQGSALSRMAEGAWKNLNPVTMAQGLYQSVRHPIDTAVGVMNAQGQQVQKARAAASQGTVGGFSQATGHALAAALPLIGPAAAEAGERVGTGDVAGGVGEGLGLILPVAGARAVVRPVLAGARVVGGSGVGRVASALERSAAARVADVMSPKVGANKARFGNQAERVAPALAKDTELASMTREGFHGKVGERLARAEEGLDAASDARLAARSFDTAPLIEALEQRRMALTAEAPDAMKPTRTVTERASPIVDEQGKPILVKTAKAEPIGTDVVPSPNAARVAVIDRAIAELQQLGPKTTYEPIRRIRQAYDGPAKAVYSPAVTADFLKAQGGKLGAADVTGVLREHLAQWDPRTAAANADYALYRTADDVLGATAEVERTRPRVGRQIIARATGAIIGGEQAGIVGAGAGFVLGDILNAALSAGVTTKLQTARIMSQLADALRAGNTAQVASLRDSLRRLATTSARQVPALGPAPVPAMAGTNSDQP